MSIQKAVHNVHNNMCTPVFIATLFIIAKIWKQPKHSSVDELIKKPWCIYTMEYYVAVKKKKILLFITDSMDGPGDYYAKRNEPVRERQKTYDLTCR